MNSFWQLFTANLKIMYRNWRGLFWNIVLPIGFYVGLSLLVGNAGDSIPLLHLNYSQYLLPGIIAITIMQTGIFSLAYWLIELRSRGVLRRFQVTPLSNTQLISSLILTRLLTMVVQVSILMAIGSYFFGVHVKGSVVVIIIMALLGGMFFLSLGFLISTVANSYDEATPITTLLNLIFTFLGNVFFPTAFFPHIIQIVARYLPITYMAEGMRLNYANYISLADSTHIIFALAIWLVIIFAVTVVSFRGNRER